jgi:hypothetical protein
MFNGRRQPSCGGTSRMTRECQVRICERLGVKFPGPTRPKCEYRLVPATAAFECTADAQRARDEHWRDCNSPADERQPAFDQIWRRTRLLDAPAAYRTYLRVYSEART